MAENQRETSKCLISNNPCVYWNRQVNLFMSVLYISTYFSVNSIFPPCMGIRWTFCAIFVIPNFDAMYRNTASTFVYLAKNGTQILAFAAFYAYVAQITMVDGRLSTVNKIIKLWNCYGIQNFFFWHWCQLPSAQISCLYHQFLGKIGYLNYYRQLSNCNTKWRVFSSLIICLMTILIIFAEN